MSSLRSDGAHPCGSQEVSKVFQKSNCFKEVTRVLQRSPKRVSRKYLRCVNEVSQVCQRSFKVIYQESCKVVSRMFKGTLEKVVSAFQGRSKSFSREP